MENHALCFYKSCLQLNAKSKFQVLINIQNNCNESRTHYKNKDIIKNTP